MKIETLENLIGEWSYLVIDNQSNRFNFCNIFEINEAMLADAENGTEYELTKQLPGDVSEAIDTMITNFVKIEDFTGVVRFEKEDTTYYVLTW